MTESKQRASPTEAQPSTTVVAPTRPGQKFWRGLRLTQDTVDTQVCGVEAHGSRERGGQITAQHHGQLAAHIGKADGTLVPLGGGAKG
jgi:hypothetical protein